MARRLSPSSRAGFLVPLSTCSMALLQAGLGSPRRLGVVFLAGHDIIFDAANDRRSARGRYCGRGRLPTRWCGRRRRPRRPARSRDRRWRGLLAEIASTSAKPRMILARKRRVGSLTVSSNCRFPTSPPPMSATSPRSREHRSPARLPEIKAEWIRAGKYVAAALVQCNVVTEAGTTGRRAETLRAAAHSPDAATKFPVAKFPPAVSNWTN